MAYVYKITSPSGRIYIGSTSLTVEERWSGYFYLKCKKQRKLYYSLSKYKPENHKFEIICECSDEDKYKLEHYYGILYNVLDQKVGLNCKLPKITDEYSSISEETRLKMLGNKNGRGKRSREVIKAISDRMSADNNHRYGIPRTEEQKRIQSLKMKGYRHSESFRLNCSENQKIPVLQFTLNNQLVREWDCGKSASKELNINAPNIAACCKNKRETAGNFKWRYKNESEEGRGTYQKKIRT